MLGEYLIRAVREDRLDLTPESIVRLTQLHGATKGPEEQETQQGALALIRMGFVDPVLTFVGVGRKGHPYFEYRTALYAKGRLEEAKQVIETLATRLK